MAKSIDPGMAFIGAVLEAQISATQEVSNRVSDLGWESAAEWAQMFADLFDAVERANDSIRVDRVLGGVAAQRSDLERTIAHFESMKISGR